MPTKKPTTGRAPHKPSFKNWLIYTYHAKVFVLAFMLVFGGVGYATLFTSEAATTELRISSIQGLPGGSTLMFTTTNHSLGNCNTPENPIFYVTDGRSCVGNTIGNSVQDPVYLWAPTNPVNGYTFSHWGGQCVATSGRRCTVYVPQGSSYDVYPVYVSTEPPAPSAPVVSIQANGQSNQTTIYAGDPLTVSWSGTNNPTSCVASGSWSGLKPASGSQFNPSDTTYSGTRGYNLRCSNGGGTSQTAGVAVNVINRQPTVTLRANNQTGNISVAKGASLSLSWSVTNFPNSCSASGLWSGSKERLGGSENRNADTATTGTKTYTIHCPNTAGQASSTVTVNVTGSSSGNPTPPTNPPSNPPGSGGPSNPTNPGSPSNPPIQGPGAPPTVVKPDTTPPTLPEEFSALADQAQGIIRLSWLPAVDDVGVTGYQLERSTDQQDWEELALLSGPDTSYDDADIAYETEYFYRLRAADAANNASEYALAQAKTFAFQSNVASSSGGTISSLDGSVEITIPGGAVSEDSQCAIIESSTLAEIDGFELVRGPFEIVCRLSSGTVITSFQQAVSVRINGVEQDDSRYTQLAVFSSKDGNEWADVEAAPDGNGFSFQIKDELQFGIFGKLKKPSIVGKILLTLVVLGAMGGGGLGLLYRRYRQQQQDSFNEYYRKAHGY